MEASSLKQQIGTWLRQAPRGSQVQAAQVLGLSQRTMRAWKRNGDAPRASRGRKRKPILLSNLRKVVSEWERQGEPGSRPVSLALPFISMRQIRLIVAQLKLRKRRRYRKIRTATRTSIVVHVPGVFMVADGATNRIGQDHIVSRDRASLKTEVSKCESSHFRARDTLKFLKTLKKNGRLPLVFGSDNGSPLCADVVSEFIKRNKVIHLKSLPRVPQHNGSAENAVREFKEVLSLGVEPEAACEILNYARHRKKIGGLTSMQFEKENFKKIENVDRAVFYESACSAIELAKLGEKSACQRRKDERQAIFETLERFSLITITKGSLALPPKQEAIS